MPDEYLSFDDALRSLQVQEAELRALVAQGKLRAFRDGNMLKFRRADIQGILNQRQGESTLVIRPSGPDETAVPQVVTPAPPEEPVDLLADEPLDYDDTAETIIGEDLLGSETAPVELTPVAADTKAAEPSTKVPTVELTAPDTGTDETEVPTLDLGEITDQAPAGSDTEVPTMVLGLDDYDDTQVATEDVATEEVSIEPGEFGAEAEAEAATASMEPAVGFGPEAEEEIAEAAVGRMTPGSAFGTGEALVVREHPSALYTVMNAIAAVILLIPGAVFFYSVISTKMPDWPILKSVVTFFWDLLGIEYPKSPY